MKIESLEVKTVQRKLRVSLERELAPELTQNLEFQLSEYIISELKKMGEKMGEKIEPKITILKVRDWKTKQDFDIDNLAPSLID